MSVRRGVWREVTKAGHWVSDAPACVEAAAAARDDGADAQRKRLDELPGRQVVQLWAHVGCEEKAGSADRATTTLSLTCRTLLTSWR